MFVPSHLCPELYSAGVHAHRDSPRGPGTQGSPWRPPHTTCVLQGAAGWKLFRSVPSFKTTGACGLACWCLWRVLVPAQRRALWVLPAGARGSGPGLPRPCLFPQHPTVPVLQLLMDEELRSRVALHMGWVVRHWSQENAQSHIPAEALCALHVSSWHRGCRGVMWPVGRAPGATPSVPSSFLRP